MILRVKIRNYWRRVLGKDVLIRRSTDLKLGRMYFRYNA